MTDQRFDSDLDPAFERDLRTTLDRLMAEPAPATLRARVERTLATPDGSDRRGRPVWLGVILALVLLGAVPLAMGLIGSARNDVDRRTPAGTPSPGRSASPTDQAPSPSGEAPASADASVPTADQIGLPVVNVSPDVVRKTRVDNMQTGARDGGPLTGPYIYDWPVSGTGTASVTDLGGGSRRIIDPSSLPVGRDEVVAGFSHNGSWMAMVVTPSNLNDCRYHATTPMPWRIEVAPIAPDGLPASAWRQVASGTEQSKFAPMWGAANNPDCAYPFPPVVDLAGDLLAWSSSSSAAPDAGSDVTVVSLATSEKVAVHRTSMRVVELHVSDQALVWAESPNILVASPSRAWKVMESRPAAAAPSPVDVGESTTDTFVPTIALDGAAVVASYADALAAERIVRVDDGRLQSIGPAAGPVACGQILAVDRGRDVVGCSVAWTGPDGTDAIDQFLAVWTAADGLRTVTLGGQVVSLPPEVSRAGDWVAWFALDFAAMSQNDASSMVGDWTAIPIDALAPPVP